MTRKQFIEKIKEPAIKEYKKHNILPSLKISQAICESAGGESSLASKYNNLFGYKWKEGCGYDYVELWTSEWDGTKYIRIKAKFRRYDSWDESLEDHSKLLLKPRYKPVIESKNYIEATDQIKKCGYATSPTYTQTLRKIIETYKLYELDWKMDFNKKLTTNFKWGEFWSGSKSGIRIEPPEELFNKIVVMANELQIVRLMINKPIIITSGYRTKEWNKHKGGVPNSYHIQGIAVDSRAIGISLLDYALYLAKYTKFMGFGINFNKNFIHTDLRSKFTIFKY